jgi:hypothetical protein
MAIKKEGTTGEVTHPRRGGWHRRHLRAEASSPAGPGGGDLLLVLRDGGRRRRGVGEPRPRRRHQRRDLGQEGGEGFEVPEWGRESLTVRSGGRRILVGRDGPTARSVTSTVSGVSPAAAMDGRTGSLRVVWGLYSDALRVCSEDSCRWLLPTRPTDRFSSCCLGPGLGRASRVLWRFVPLGPCYLTV